MNNYIKISKRKSVVMATESEELLLDESRSQNENESSGEVVAVSTYIKPLHLSYSHLKISTMQLLLNETLQFNNNFLLTICMFILIKKKFCIILEVVKCTNWLPLLYLRILKLL